MDADYEKYNGIVEDYISEKRPKDSVHVKYSVGKNGTYTDVNKVAHEGKIQFIVLKDEGEFWRHDDYESPVLENPTWLEVCLHANDMIIKTGDLHHIYLEGINVDTEVEGVSVANFSMGS